MASRTMEEPKKSGADKMCCGACCLLFLILVIVIPAASFASLEQLDLGLNYDSISLTVEDKVYDSAGLYFLGFGHWFIRYPRTVQNLEFSADENDRLQTRTSDGLPVKLSVSFQYRYDAARLRQLYLTFKQEELRVYESTAKAVIANVATNFSAYNFFNDKQGIATEMQLAVTRVFDEQLMARVEAFQITRVELPAQFQEAVMDSIEAKQNITERKRYKDNMKVTFSQQVLVANQTKQQTIALSRGTARQRLERAGATAAVIEQSVHAEMYAFGNLSATVDLNVSEALSYIWWSGQLDMAEKDATGKEFLVGLDPQSVIRTRSP